MALTTCSAYTFMETRHGPRAILSGNTLLTGLFGRAAPAEEARVMAEFIGTDQPISVALTPSADWKTGRARYHIPMDLSLPDALLGLAYLPVLLLLAYYRALARGAGLAASYAWRSVLALSPAQSSTANHCFTLARPWLLSR